MSKEDSVLDGKHTGIKGRAMRLDFNPQEGLRDCFKARRVLNGVGRGPSTPSLIAILLYSFLCPVMISPGVGCRRLVSM